MDHVLSNWGKQTFRCEPENLTRPKVRFLRHQNQGGLQPSSKACEIEIDNGADSLRVLWLRVTPSVARPELGRQLREQGLWLCVGWWGCGVWGGRRRGEVGGGSEKGKRNHHPSGNGKGPRSSPRELRKQNSTPRPQCRVAVRFVMCALPSPCALRNMFDQSDVTRLGV